MPLLTDQNFLAIPAASIKGKAYLAPTALDKSAGKTGGYYPDFSVWELALPVLVVEAKEPEVAVQVGFREASLYARHLNEDYKSGVNPCKFILACNGVDLAYGTWDSNAATMVKVADLRIGSNDLEALQRFCHHRLLAAHAAQRSSTSIPRPIRSARPRTGCASNSSIASTGKIRRSILTPTRI
jgi:type I site-specific restriction endonuclease